MCRQFINLSVLLLASLNCHLQLFLNVISSLLLLNFVLFCFLLLCLLERMCNNQLNGNSVSTRSIYLSILDPIVFTRYFSLQYSRGNIYSGKLHQVQSFWSLYLLCLALTACPVLLHDPEVRSPVLVPLLPITAYRLTENLPDRFHIAVFHCFHCGFVCGVRVPPPSFSLSCFLFSLHPSFSPSLFCKPTSLLVLQGEGAVLVLLLFLPRTDVQKIPSQGERVRERARKKKKHMEAD